MFNFKTLKLTKRCDSDSTNSFVGIRRNENGELEFRLPHGFDNFPEDDFDATKNFFFKMYRTFKKFERDDWRQNNLDARPAGKDNVETEKNGYRFKDKQDNDVILYSKISLIENLLEVYKDLALNVMERRIARDEKVDYSKIEHYLHRAIYLPKDVIFIDEMDLPRQTLNYESTTLIDLFCFIVTELQNELEQDIEPRAQELAHRFSEKHLNHEESLFNEETFETTICTLKNVLDDIDKRTAYKDDDYWRLFEAIELFLYGELDMEQPDENGIYWGINNFSSVWEDMCATESFSYYNYTKDIIVYADTNIIFNGEHIANFKSAGYFPVYKKEDFSDSFFIEFRGKRRWIRPDFVVALQKHKSFWVHDWKYMEEKKFFDVPKKIKMDITKQLCYEFILNKKLPNKKWLVISDFAIPWFFPNVEHQHTAISHDDLPSVFKKNYLLVTKFNFVAVQSEYLTHD